MHRTTARRILKNREKEVLERPDGKLQEWKHKAMLEEIRFEGRKQLIDFCNLGAAMGYTSAIARVHEMTPMQAAKFAAICTDKGLLLSGQPVDKIGRTDTRMMSDEELALELANYSKAGHEEARP